MTIAIFWLQHQVPFCETFGESQFSVALDFASKKRTEQNVSHVSIVSEPKGMVGTKDAGGAVQDGKLPNGQDYTWRKRR